jgi:steroid 5-alpha reductase family enzyme
MALWAALVSFAVTAIGFGLLWVLSLKRRDCSVVDLYWAFGFAVIAWVEIGVSGNADTPALVLATLVTIWALRLGLHLVRRHAAADGEDPRYLAMRLRNGPGWERRSFWMIFMLQAVCMWLVASPIHVAVLGPAGFGIPPFLAAVLLAAGLAMFAAGFLLESAADAALARFKARPENRGRLLTTGLFAWSRHPNYFGEALLWWGLGLVAVAFTGQPLALAGPAILNLLLVKVSGVPPLEEHLSGRPGFADYAARTPAFVPRPPRRPEIASLSPSRDPAE